MANSDDFLVLLPKLISISFKAVNIRILNDMQGKYFHQQQNPPKSAGFNFI